MGAATSLMYGSDDKQISAIVADSPFTSLEDIIKDLVLNFQKWIPNTVISIGIEAMRRSILKKANFDIKKKPSHKLCKKIKSTSTNCTCRR